VEQRSPLENVVVGADAALFRSGEVQRLKVFVEMIYDLAFHAFGIGTGQGVTGGRVYQGDAAGGASQLDETSR
jgi:hypothetical protein